VKIPCIRPELNEKLLLYIENMLPEQQQEVALHLKECKACAEEVKKAQEIHGILKAGAQVFSQLKPITACISPELLTDYCDRKDLLPAATLEVIEEHLAGCAACTRDYECLVMLREELQQEPVVKGSVRGEVDFLSKVARIFTLRQPAARRSFGTEAINRFREAVDGFKEWSSDMFSPQAQLVFVRKTLRRFQENVSVIKKSMKGLDLNIEIEPRDEHNVDVILFVTSSRAQENVQGIRASLFHKQQEMISLFVEKGKASFKTIPHGGYEIILLRQGNEIMKVQFKTK